MLLGPLSGTEHGHRDDPNCTQNADWLYLNDYDRLMMQRPGRDLPAWPDDLVVALSCADVNAAELRNVRTSRRPRPVEQYAADGIVVDLATAPSGRDLNRLELRGRRWASGLGLDTPEVLAAAADGTWVLSRRLPLRRASGVGYVDQALLTAEVIAGGPPPPPGPPATAWRGSRRSLVARTVRGVAAGVPLRLWWAARAAARSLPQVPIAHGDFYHRNVLWPADRDRVAVVDWEYLGPGPRHGDLVRMWTILPDADDRGLLLDRLLGRLPRGEWREVGTLLVWLSLRLLGENAKAPRRHRSPADLAHARRMVPEALRIATGLGAWPP